MFEIRRFDAASAPETEALFRLICELAEFERLPVVTSRDALARALADPTRTSAAIAYDDDIPIGYLVWYRTFSTFRGAERLFLEDLYVTPSQRRRGYGRKMLSWLARLGLEENLRSMHWQVLDWNTSAIDFYRGLGATIDASWLDCQLSDGGLVALARSFTDGVPPKSSDSTS